MRRGTEQSMMKERQMPPREEQPWKKQKELVFGVVRPGKKMEDSCLKTADPLDVHLACKEAQTPA